MKKGTWFWDKSVKSMFLLKIFSSAEHRSHKMCMAMLANEGSTKIVYFMTPRGGILVVGRDYTIHELKMHSFYKSWIKIRKVSL